MTREPNTVIQAAQMTLAIGQMGLADYMAEDPVRRRSGMHNAIVFGRAVTNILETLRNSVDGDFDAWYKSRTSGLSRNAAYKRLYQMRSEILKQGLDGTTSSTYVAALSTESLAGLPRPKGATHFFIGDQNGGAGWMVPRPDGSEDVFYVELPPSAGFVSKRTMTVEGAELDVGSVLTDYLDEMKRLVNEAEQRFGG